MKVKLLKKVRRRFSIVHMPKGLITSARHFKHNLYEMTDRENSYATVYAQLGKTVTTGNQFCDDDEIFDTAAECINYLKARIIKILISEGHRNAIMRRAIGSQKKVWHI